MAFPLSGSQLPPTLSQSDAAQNSEERLEPGHLKQCPWPTVQRRQIHSTVACSYLGWEQLLIVYRV